MSRGEAGAPAPVASTKPRTGLPPLVWGLGLVSFLTDVASDMVVPLMPALLASVGGGALALGVLEGLAEGVSALSKWWGGKLADRKASAGPLVVGGYGVAAAVRPLYAWIGAPWHAYVLRVVDRLGKGLRTAPRDALIAGSVPAGRRAYAFGVHRAMDNLGAVGGGLVSFALLSWLEWSLHDVLLASFVPGALSTALAAALLLRKKANEPTSLEVREEPPKASDDASARDAAPGAANAVTPFSRPLVTVLASVAIFSLACSADAFLLAHLLALGVELRWIPLIWIALQLGKSLLNAPGGWLADKVGVGRATLASFVVYAVSYAGFALVSSPAAVIALFALYAAHYGLGEGADKALVARLAPEGGRGRALGTFHAASGVGMLLANLAFGALYLASPGWAFGSAAAIALLASAVLAVGLLAERAASRGQAGHPA